MRTARSGAPSTTSEPRNGRVGDTFRVLGQTGQPGEDGVAEFCIGLPGEPCEDDVVPGKIEGHSGV